LFLLLDGSRSGRRLRLAFRALRAFRTFGTLYTLRTLCSFRAFNPFWPLGPFYTLRHWRADVRLLEAATRRFAVAATMTIAIRRLITFAPAETAFALIAVAAMGAPVVAVAVAAALSVALIAITTVAPEILTVATVPAIAPIEPLLVASIMAVIAVVVEALVARRPVVVAVLIVEVPRLLLLLRERLLRVRLCAATLTKLRLCAELVTVLVAEVLAIRTLGPGKRMRPRGTVAHGVNAALLRHLLAIAENDAVVVLSVLEIILCQHGIARRQRVTRQGYVLLGDVRGRAANFHIRPRALETAHQGILRFTVIVIVVVSTATATVLLTLPHGLPFMLVDTLPTAHANLYAAPWILRSNSISRF